MSKSFSLPFRFSESGGISETSNLNKLWQDRVLSVIATRPGERVNRPTFGSRVGELLFENEKDASQAAVREVTAAFNLWLQDLRLLDVKVKTSESSIGDTVLNVTVEYKLPNNQTDVVTVKVGDFNRSGTLIEEINHG
jgi:hypothetical protein